MSSLRAGVISQLGNGERRIAVIPRNLPTLAGVGIEVVVEAGAGAAAGFHDDAYRAAGADVVPAAVFEADLERGAIDLVLAVGGPTPAVANRLASGGTFIGMLDRRADADAIRVMADRGVTVVSLDGVPRTLTRAQSMDALSSQANIAGYKAVLLAGCAFGRFFPMLVTAAGTAPPAKVLVLGVGVAGLQAISTARRLGAVVSAYDLRPEALAEADSVGAAVVRLPADVAGAHMGTGGYAAALAHDRQHALRKALEEVIAHHDVVIAAARVPGRPPPVLVSGDALAGMTPGSVVVDLAAGELGGNVEGSSPGRTIDVDGVTVIGAADLPATMPVAASTAYSANICALVTYLASDGRLVFDPADEVVDGVLVAYQGTLRGGGR